MCRWCVDATQGRAQVTTEVGDGGTVDHSRDRRSQPRHDVTDGSAIRARLHSPDVRGLPVPLLDVARGGAKVQCPVRGALRPGTHVVLEFERNGRLEMLPMKVARADGDERGLQMAGVLANEDPSLRRPHFAAFVDAMATSR